MATLFLLSSIVTSLVQPTQPSHCQTLTDIFETARSYFYKKKYIESYRLFFELEHTHRLKPSQCAWFQIQCLIHLGYWRQSIKKCQELIQVQPSVSQWYLIASEIYMERLDFTLAWEELNKASQIIYKSDDAYNEICIKKRMVLEGKYLGIVRKDILDILPYDITCDIFNCLDLASLVRCTRVCKKWRHFLVSSAHLWNELYFCKKSAHLEMETVNTYFDRAKRIGLTKLSIRYQQTDGDSILMALVKYECYRLNTLIISDIICTPGLFFNILEYVGNNLKKLQWGGVSIRLNDIIDNLPKICKHLTHLTIHDCFTSLQDLHLQNGVLHRLEFFGESFPLPFIQSIQSLPKLNYIQQLELNDIHGLTANHLANILIRCPVLVKLVLIRCLVNIVPVLNILRISCPKLQHFEYERNRYCQQFDVFQHTEERRLANRAILQQLKNQKQGIIKKEWIQLEIRQTNMLTNAMIQSILFTRDALQVLDISGNTMISDTALKQPMRCLKVICLKECYGLTSKGIECIIRQSPLLEKIDLSCLSVINNDILYALSKCSKLCQVNLSYCKLSKVSDEAIKYLVDKRKDTLKRLVLDFTMYVSIDVLMYTIKNLKRGII